MKKNPFIIIFLILYLLIIGTLSFFVLKEKAHITKSNLVKNEVTIPKNCISWHDGCNYCSTKNGNLLGCTLMACTGEERKKNARCTYFSYNNPQYELTFNYPEKWKICPSDIEKFGVNITRQELDCYSLSVEQTPKTLTGEPSKYLIPSFSIQKINEFKLENKNQLNCSDYNDCLRQLKIYKTDPQIDTVIHNVEEIKMKDVSAIKYNWGSPAGYGGTTLLIKNGSSVGALVELGVSYDSASSESSEVRQILSTIEFTNG